MTVWVWLDRLATLSIVSANTVWLWRIHRKLNGGGGPP